MFCLLLKLQTIKPKNPRWASVQHRPVLPSAYNHNRVFYWQTSRRCRNNDFYPETTPCSWAIFSKNRDLDCGNHQATIPHEISTLKSTQPSQAATNHSQRVVEAQSVPRMTLRQSPRVENPIQQQLRRIQWQGKQHPIGTSIIKQFVGKLYQGWAIVLDRQQGYYKVGYDDGNKEEMTYKQMQH